VPADLIECLQMKSCLTTRDYVLDLLHRLILTARLLPRGKPLQKWSVDRRSIAGETSPANLYRRIRLRSGTGTKNTGGVQTPVRMQSFLQCGISRQLFWFDWVNSQKLVNPLVLFRDHNGVWNWLKRIGSPEARYRILGVVSLVRKGSIKWAGRWSV